MKIILLFLWCAGLQACHPGPNLQRRRWPELKPPGKPCGEACYLLLDDVKQLTSFDNIGKSPLMLDSGNEACSEDSNDSSQCSKDATLTKSSKNGSNLFEIFDLRDTEWNGSDKSFFRTLQKTFLNNYCAIAEAMLTKTCQQVYRFVQQEAAACLPIEVNKDNTPPRKKKKKHRLWSVHCRRKIAQIMFSTIHLAIIRDNAMRIAHVTVLKIFVRNFATAVATVKIDFLDAAAKLSVIQSNALAIWPYVSAIQTFARRVGLSITKLVR
uniref:Uncharacterized protein n=1 Tax=Anopheles merus TaxID=30066 RepID=A0A182UXD8_ANOME